VAGKLTLDDGHDGALLDGRRALETVGVDATEELGLEVHAVEAVGGLIVVGLDLRCLVLACAHANLQLRALAVAVAGAHSRRSDLWHLLSGTSSKPLSAMFAVGEVGDVCCCRSLVEAVGGVAGDRLDAAAVWELFW
jgi:hypothetical protein